MGKNNNLNISEKPKDWPETFTRATLSCNHAYTWDTSAGCYYCIYCQERKDRPPQSSIEAHIEFLEKKEKRSND